MSKRLLLARALRYTGLLPLIERLPTSPGILVLNHHRIGDAASTRFDRGVFSETQDGLERQVSMVRKRMPIVAGEELEALITGAAPLKRTYAVITFDDGYLDNYKNAFPVLKSLGVPGIFFTVADYMGTSTVPWWDEIAYLVRNTERCTVTVQTPEPLEVTIGEDREAAILQLLRHYKKPSNHDGGKFLQELRESAACTVPPVGRRFLDWNEARTMAAAGMDFGSHTCSHTILSQQSTESQQWELETSKALMEKELNRRVRYLAYPVGSSTAFTQQTEALALAAGFSAAFAFHGGWNPAGSMRPSHLQRISPSPDPLLLRLEVAMLLHGNRGRA